MTYNRTVHDFIAHLDTHHNAKDWDYRAVAGYCAVLFLLIRTSSLASWDGKTWRGGIEWHALLHAIMVGGGAGVCLYLDHYYAEEVGGSPEPLRTIRCEGPLTSLHKILPAISLGYSLCDVLNGVCLGSLDFLLHGLSLGSVMLVVCAIDQQHTITQMLLMEVSTIPLVLMEGTFFSSTLVLVFQALFALSFFLVRIVIVPYLWFQFVVYFFWEESRVNNEGASKMCFPHFFIYVVLIFGVVFHGLNLYWFRKVIRKVRRKLAELSGSPPPPKKAKKKNN